MFKLVFDPIFKFTRVRLSLTQANQSRLNRQITAPFRQKSDIAGTHYRAAHGMGFQPDWSFCFLKWVLVIKG
jgi:hypothetical protein